MCKEYEKSFKITNCTLIGLACLIGIQLAKKFSDIMEIELSLLCS
jgi:hypothetical protein